MPGSFMWPSSKSSHVLSPCRWGNHSSIHLIAVGAVKGACCIDHVAYACFYNSILLPSCSCSRSLSVSLSLSLSVSLCLSLSLSVPLCLSLALPLPLPPLHICLIWWCGREIADALWVVAMGCQTSARLQLRSCWTAVGLLSACPTCCKIAGRFRLYRLLQNCCWPAARLLLGWCWAAAKWLLGITMGSVQTAAELLPDCF